jgi:hypothetical protein
MASCVDNPRCGIIGCGATYTGERQHSVARVAWSDSPDGRAHVSGTVAQIDSLWRDGRMRHPDELKSGLYLTDDRQLRYPAPEGGFRGIPETNGRHGDTQGALFAAHSNTPEAIRGTS